MPIPHDWTTEDILALSLARCKGPVLRRLVEECASPEEGMHALRATQTSLFTDETLASLRERAARQTELCSRHAVDIVSFWDDRYPALLREIYYPPVLLFVRGTLQPADALAVGIVGTRKCTSYGRLTTERFAETFARSGVVVVSGLAFGVDTAAHKATLACGGTTYAVIASGIDTVGPYLAERLAREISDRGGAVISEYPCGVKALPAYFPQRNRIISGISKATVVVESRERGGALITAGFALDQNRELFAVPGNITSEQSRGTNMLIKNSQAVPALSPDEVLESIGVAPAGPATADGLFDDISGRARAVYDSIGHEPLHVDTIAERCGTPIHELLVYLLELEFRGAVRQLPGKQFVRV